MGFQAPIAPGDSFAIPVPIREMTNRVCGMLARQGGIVGTLYELTWMSLPNEEAKRQFQAANSTAKQKMRTRLDKDEKDLAERLRAVVAETGQ